MKGKYIVICISLLISLFIYLFYRTDRTVVNEVLISFISFDKYTSWKVHIAEILPLNNSIIYSLPEGLWVFCITLTSKPYYIKMRNWRIEGVIIPLVFSITLEIFQYLHLANGRFDVIDIGFCVVFWVLGCLVFNKEREKQNIFTRPGLKTIFCLASYCIVYLAHVFK